MSDREERLGKNEAVFREVNERIREVTIVPAETQFLCECADASCTAPVSMTLSAYEGVRTNPRHFLIVPGHEVLEVEDVVEEHEAFTVVRKKAGDAAGIAIATDPRS
jgi:hypothetical protein